MDQPLVRWISLLIVGLSLSEIRSVASSFGVEFSRYVKNMPVVSDRRSFRLAKRPKQTTLPVGHSLGLGVLVVTVMMVGLLIVLVFILSKYPWGTAPGCWAQC